jgi:hypothetical protein
MKSFDIRIPYSKRIRKEYGIEDTMGHSYSFFDKSPIKDLINGNIVVSKRKELAFVLYYPFSTSPVFHYSSSKSWTLKKVLQTLVKAYHRAYREDTKKNHYPYGVWGHALEDLTIDTIRIDRGGIVTCENSS